MKLYGFLPARLWMNGNRNFFKDPKLKPLSDLYPSVDRNFLQCKTNVYSISNPVLSIEKDSIQGNSRYLKATISTTRDAQNCQIRIKNDVQLSNVTINGKAITDQKFYTDTIGGYHTFYYFGIKEKPIEIRLVSNSIGRIEVTVVESKLGLPEFDGYKRMPNFIIPDKGFYSNVSLLKKTWTL